VFIDKRNGQPLQDDAVNQRILAAIEQDGCDAWFAQDPAVFLGPDHDPDNFEKVDDILDVWFDSGSTHAFVLEARDDLQWPADLYLEGSDQHRGWFHSSLLVSSGTRGRAPYNAVLTHGFTMDQNGEKMSKSRGNGVDPQDVIDQYGADILRLWSVSMDYFNDHRIGPKILKSVADSYRRLRNTIRFMLGSLDGYTDAEALDVADMPELERYMLHRLHEMDAAVRNAANQYDFHRLFVEVFNFCNAELSNFYFDIRKDTLYCDAASSVERRACRTVIDRLFRSVVGWLAPILCFTAEEAWLSRFPGEDESVHLTNFPDIPDAWTNVALAEKWNDLKSIRRVATGALEIERREKRIGSSLQAAPVVYLDEKYRDALTGVDLGELFITSGATVEFANGPAGAFRLDDVDGVAVVPSPAQGHKCARCWMVLPEVKDEESICNRCESVLAVA